MANDSSIEHYSMRTSNGTTINANANANANNSDIQAGGIMENVPVIVIP
jgi:hypothetical protein